MNVVKIVAEFCVRVTLQRSNVAAVLDWPDVPACLHAPATASQRATQARAAILSLPGEIASLSWQVIKVQKSPVPQYGLSFLLSRAHVAFSRALRKLMAIFQSLSRVDFLQ